ncbi:ferritin heavy chain-like [Dama dama]
MGILDAGTAESLSDKLTLAYSDNLSTVVSTCPQIPPRDPANSHDLFLNQSQAQALTPPNERHYPCNPEPNSASCLLARLRLPTASTMGRFERVRGRRRRRPRPRRFQPRRRLIRAAIPWFLEWPTVLPTPPSQVHQNHHPECEAAINSQTSLEFHVSFHCRAVAFYLDLSDDVALKHFSGFFLLRSHEHSKTAESLMFLQNRRGGRISFLDIRNPESQEWESGLQAMQDILHLEKYINQSLIDLHQLATESCDADLCHFLETGYLDQQVKFIKELEDHVSSLSNARSPEGALAEYFSEKLTLSDGDKED